MEEILYDIRRVTSGVLLKKNSCPLLIKDFFDDKEYKASVLYAGNKRPYYEVDKSEEIVGPDLFEKYKNDPLHSPWLRTKSLQVVKTDTKISVKLRGYYLGRESGVPYFKKSTSYHSFTYNFKRNQFFICTINNQHKKRNFQKTLRCISPYHFFGNLSAHVQDSFRVYETNWDDPERVLKLFLEGISDDIVNEVDLLEYVVKKQGFKLPNNFDVFAERIRDYGCRIPTKIYGKKYGFKYIDTVMGINILSGDKLRRVLHKVSNFNLNLYYEMATFFSDKFMLSRPDEDLINIFNSYILHSGLLKPEDVNLTKQEKINMFNIIMEKIKHRDADMYDIADHLRFKVKLSKYEKVKWKSKTVNEFIDEHHQWSLSVDSYTKGLVKRRYNKEFINEITKSIIVGDDTYYPVLLTNTDEYNMESSLQMNCVRTYSMQAHSVIVSLRKNSPNSDERLTIELGVKPGEYFDLKRVQTKARRNTPPGVEWESALFVLDMMITTVNQKKLFTLHEMDVEYKMGLPRHAKAKFKDFGYYSTVCWDDEDVDEETGTVIAPVIDEDIPQGVMDYLLQPFDATNYANDDDDLPL